MTRYRLRGTKELTDLRQAAGIHHGAVFHRFEVAFRVLGAVGAGCHMRGLCAEALMSTRLTSSPSFLGAL